MAMQWLRVVSIISMETSVQATRASKRERPQTRSKLRRESIVTISAATFPICSSSGCNSTSRCCPDWLSGAFSRSCSVRWGASGQSMGRQPGHRLRHGDKCTSVPPHVRSTAAKRGRRRLATGLEAKAISRLCWTSSDSLRPTLTPTRLASNATTRMIRLPMKGRRVCGARPEFLMFLEDERRFGGRKPSLAQDDTAMRMPA